MSWLRGSQAKLSTRISHDLVKEHRIWCFLLDILQWDSVLLMLTNSSKDSCSRGLEYTTLSQKVCIACQKMRILPLGNAAIGCLGSKFLFLFFLIPGTHRRIIASQAVLVVESPPENSGHIRDTGLIPGLGRPPGEGHDNPLQHSCLENSMHRGAWRAMVHRAAQSGTTEGTGWT